MNKKTVRLLHDEVSKKLNANTNDTPWYEWSELFAEKLFQKILKDLKNNENKPNNN